MFNSYIMSDLIVLLVVSDRLQFLFKLCIITRVLSEQSIVQITKSFS